VRRPRKVGLFLTSADGHQAIEQGAARRKKSGELQKKLVALPHREGLRLHFRPGFSSLWGACLGQLPTTHFKGDSFNPYSNLLGMAEPIRIFLLEDDQDLREALESVLELEGYEVVSAADGAEAVVKASNQSFDIIVFDVKLPGPDGLEVFAQFKKENPDLLSVVMTGYATEQDTIRALRLGVGDYLKKPFRSTVLLEAVRRLESEVWRRRKLEERERSARSMMIWSLEFMVGGLEMAQRGTGLNYCESGRIARRFALAQGFSAESVEELQSAVLYSFLKTHSEDHQRIASLLDVLPPRVISVVREMEQALEEERELEPKTLAGLGVLCTRLPTQKGLLSELQQAVGVPLGGDLPQREDRGRRQLLSLGRTLAASGEVEAAAEAFLGLAQESRSPEAGQGWLELARLAWATGDKKGANVQLRQLVTLLPQLGPQAGAELELEAGLTALGMGFADGRQLVERSQEKLHRMGLPGLYHQSVLVLRAARSDEHELGPQEIEALEFLAEQGIGALLLSHSWWLLRPFLELQIRTPHLALRKLLRRLVQDATRSVGKTLDSGLNAPELELLLQLIEEGGASAFVAPLQRLFAQVKRPELRSRIEQILSGVTQQDTPTLRLYSLGPFEVWIGDHRLPEKAWRTYRSRFLLACLASRQGRPLLAETVIEQFWPGARPESGKKNLSQSASDLRRTLSEGGFELADEALSRKHELIALNRDLPLWHDLDSFRTELAAGKTALESGRTRLAHQHLRQAFALIRGEYLEDCPMEWVTNQRREVERLSTECCELLAKTCTELELYPESIEVANRILDSDPCHQALHLLVMQAQTAQGRPELALRQFDQVRASLQLELGVEPSTELLRAQQIAKMAL
jgi:DNA-binding response OmpR family regulator